MRPQVGNTTLAWLTFAGLPYRDLENSATQALSLEDPRFSSMPTPKWACCWKAATACTRWR
ncbi:MAG: hypothetical protein HY778_14535 [Betaproteobacteria bacterium]|nr:hypothetical protein [Betaproteobacteria bacterium]